MSKNLLKNPNGDEQLQFWELTDDGGYGWKVEDLPVESDKKFSKDGVTKYFATSLEPCTKRQLINLKAAGFTNEQLDAAPNIVVEDWYSGRKECSSTYMLTVYLLDQNYVLLRDFKLDPVTLDPESDDGSWKKVTHTFSGYGRGLRWVCFDHGGHANKFMEGWFGVRITGSSVTVEV